MAKREGRDVLRYTQDSPTVHTGQKRTIAHRHYLHLRMSQGPLHCDNPDCVFNKEPPVWNGKDLPLTLDQLQQTNFYISPAVLQ